MPVKLSARDTSLPWANVEVPYIIPLYMPLDALAEALDALGWRTRDLEALIGRNLAVALQARAEREGKEYTGPKGKLSGRDEILTDQFLIFGALRAAKFRPTWQQIAGLGRDEFDIAADVAPQVDAVEGDEPAEDPQVPSTGSVPAVDAVRPTGGVSAQGRGQRSRKSSP